MQVILNNLNVKLGNPRKHVHKLTLNTLNFTSVNIDITFEIKLSTQPITQPIVRR